MNFNIVTESYSSIRRLARDILRGKWGISALATLIYMVAVSLPSVALDYSFGATSPISTIYMILVAGPFSLGYAMFALSVLRDNNPNPLQVFYGFERFTKAIGAYLLMTICICLWTLLFIIPGIIAAIRYSQVFFILADEPEIGVFDAFEKSKAMMRGNKATYFVLQLTFIGWAIVALFSVGIGYIFLLPYMEIAFVVFYEMVNGRLTRRDGNISQAIEITATEVNIEKSIKLDKEDIKYTNDDKQ